MSSLSDLVAQLESGGGANNASQPASMVNPTYGQYSAFATQYGSGAPGVDNYAGQFLAANPNATVGDFYSNYVLGTGSASNPQNIYSDLQAQYPSAASNLANNINPDTSLASLTSNPALGFSIVGDTASGSGSDGNFAAVTPSTDNPFYIPGTDTSLIGNDEAQATDIPLGSVGNILGSQSTGSANGTAAGASTGGSGFFDTLFTDIENWFERGAIVILGLIFVGVASWALANTSKIRAAIRA